MASPENSVTPLDPAAESVLARRATPDQSSRGGGFPIVGIGCSAGGFDALERFFGHVPPDSGLAYVVVQHLAPDYPSSLPELLQRATSISVVEAVDAMPVQPDRVFVIPPNKDLTLENGLLHLQEPIARRGLRLPFDFFLQALAEERQELAVGVVLSGMGSDGVAGLRVVKECGGVTFAQDPASAQADSMPRCAIEAGVVDVVGKPEALPDRILEALRRPAQPAPAERLRGQEVPHDLDTAKEISEPAKELDLILLLLRERTGNDFTLYKTNTLYRRIERRIALHQLGSIADYLDFLRANPLELDLLFKELLIGVTSFFRDPAVWHSMRVDAIPALLARAPSGKTLRAWVPGCSTGEEAYSLAMSFREALEETLPGSRFDLQIYATDLDPDAIETARRGVYPASIAADVSPERLARHFVVEGDGYRIRKDIREMVVFAPQNIISDPPFTRLDILCCRNLLIYFRPRLQKKLLPLFHYALNRGGVLLLGSAETLGTYAHLFAPVNQLARIFLRLDQGLPISEVEFPQRAVREAHPDGEAAKAEHAESMELLTDSFIQQNYAPAAVLVNGDGDILYISGRTGKYLEPAAGKVNINIHAMAREGLREALTGVIRKALREREPVKLAGLEVSGHNGSLLVNVTVHPLERPEPLKGRVLIVFQDMPAPPVTRSRRKSVAAATHIALLQELEQARDALQITHEEMQTSMEELKSSNEELQSTNEELQSTNEELTTSKEEMQSLNEELQTVNSELHGKVNDLTWVKNDMTNLLNSIEIATIFLDSEMGLRRFTPHATNLFKLIPSDVGRPITHVVTDLDYPGLKEDAEEVLRSLVFQERQARTYDGRWYRVRIMPYRTQDNVIDGVVITFIDITELRKLEAALQNQLSPP
ncbi:PAS domain-containing protein [Niveibacterium sp. 24ML]|uniref:chemotaxis protein CheB n=1 Tax=Niveibacterium sp. 24ML TaxID=2985512 RepID=UPI00226DD73D|nr:chemotaxis protein CheB [Niveibacterium sp. 24ML]MCX9157221.1 PAS domain-containing protein [Niveibacterium sp. 24ML]